MEASKEATKRVGQLNLGPDPPVLEDSCRSLPAVAEFIAKVAADVRVFKSNIVTQLANDKNTASKQTAALVIAAYRDANPGAVVPDFLSEISFRQVPSSGERPCHRSGQEEVPASLVSCIIFEHFVPQHVINFALDFRLHLSEHAVIGYVLLRYSML